MSLIEQLKGVKIVNPGFLLDLPTGLALDDQGYLKIRGIIFDKYTDLKLDDDGNIVTAGILSEKPTGFYIDEEGWLYHNGGIFILDESLGIRIDEEGRLYKMHWTGLDERIELKDAIRIPLAQSEPVDYASEYNTSSSTSSTNTDERSLSGSSGGGSSGKIIFWVFASLAIIIYAQFDKKADAEKIENQRAKMQAMLPEIARSKMDSTLLVPPKNGIVKFGPKATISVAANGLKIDYPRERKSTTIYFSDVRSFYNLNNPKYDDKNHPCFTVVWAHYELNQITWRFRHPSDLLTRQENREFTERTERTHG